MSSTADTIHDRRRPAAEAARQIWTRSRWPRLLLMFALPLVLVLTGTWWYLTAGRYVSTDDAYVQSDMVTISSDVPGRVVGVDVHNNEYVQAGQILYRLDDRPYRIAVERAEAQLASARLQVDGMRATYKQRQADLAAAQDTLSYQTRERDRQQQLLASHVTSQAQFDQTRNRLETARQQTASAQQQIANVLASLGGNPNIPTEQHPLVQQAQAQLDQAKLDFSHTIVTAPSNGIVTKVDKLPIGTYLNAATAAFSLVETDHVWVEANFKETELTHMRPGQEAEVTVDAYPGTTFKAHVESLSPGTGSEFSVLPAQNATGNWVKVVQRVPVRIVVDTPDPNQPLRIGMSVTADVDTQYRGSIAAKLAAIF